MGENDGNEEGVKEESEKKADEDDDVHVRVFRRLHVVLPWKLAVRGIFQRGFALVEDITV